MANTTLRTWISFTRKHSQLKLPHNLPIPLSPLHGDLNIPPRLYQALRDRHLLVLKRRRHILSSTRTLNLKAGGENGDERQYLRLREMPPGTDVVT